MLRAKNLFQVRPIARSALLQSTECLFSDGGCARFRRFLAVTSGIRLNRAVRSSIGNYHREVSRMWDLEQLKRNREIVDRIDWEMTPEKAVETYLEWGTG
mgnify:CR=1 FL=1